MVKGVKQKRNETAIAVLAVNVRKHRKAKNLTILDLANRAGVDYSQIGRMERGVVNPSVSIIFDIARALDILPSQLLEY